MSKLVPRFNLFTLAAELDRVAAELRQAGASGVRTEVLAAVRATVPIPVYAHEILNSMCLRPAERPLLDAELADLGWDVEYSTTKRGWGHTVGTTVWMSRWDWHGEAIDKVCYHFSATDAAGVRDARDKLALLVMRAWSEFREPGLPPRQSGDHLHEDDTRKSLRTLATGRT